MGATVAKKNKIALRDALSKLITRRGMRMLSVAIDRLDRKGDPILGMLCDPKNLAKRTGKRRHHEHRNDDS
jgi:hypothetical protein